MKSNDSKNNQKNNHSPHSHYKAMAEDDVALQILNIIDRNPRVSQRKITVQTGVAAGLVHSFMSRVINKGLVRAKKVSAKRWLYFLTPKGFIEKSRLTLRFLYGTFNSYRDTQKIIVKLLEKSCDNKYFNFIIAGENELAEILCLNIRVSKVITLVGIVANDPESKIMAGNKIQPFSALEELEFDKILVCDLEHEQYIKKYIKDNKLKLDQDKIINLVDMLVNLNQ